MSETCNVTVWLTIAPTYNGRQGVRVLQTARCGEPLVGQFCAKHQADKERLL